MNDSASNHRSFVPAHVAQTQKYTGLSILYQKTVHEWSLHSRWYGLNRVYRMQGITRISCVSYGEDECVPGPSVYWKFTKVACVSYAQNSIEESIPCTGKSAESQVSVGEYIHRVYCLLKQVSWLKCP